MHPRHQAFFVVGAIEDADAAALRQRDHGAPHEVVIEFVGRRLLEGRDFAALRIDAFENALDRAVLAGGIHALEDHQQRPAVLRVQLLLEIVEALAVGLDDLFALLLVETASFTGLVHFQMKFAHAVEPERRDKGFQPLGQRQLGLLAHGGVYPENWASRNAVTKRGITGTRSDRERTRCTARKLRLGLAGEIGLNPRLERLARQFDLQYPNHRNRRPSKYAGPVRVHGVVGRIEAGFFSDLAHDAAGEIEPAVADIVGIGRAGRKIDAPGIRGVAAHFAEQECAVGRSQRAHAKTVEDAFVRKTPIAPRQETRKVGLEEIGAKMLAGADRVAAEQDAAVPEFGLVALFRGKMRVDLTASFFRKRPCKGPHGKIERRDAMNFGRGRHAKGSGA